MRVFRGPPGGRAVEGPVRRGVGGTVRVVRVAGRAGGDCGLGAGDLEACLPAERAGGGVAAGDGRTVSKLVDGRLRSIRGPAPAEAGLAAAASCWDGVEGSSSEDSAKTSARESAGEGALGVAASAGAPSGEMKRCAASAWRSKKSASSVVFLRRLRRATS